MDNKDVEFFDFDDFNLDDLDFKKSEPNVQNTFGVEINNQNINNMQSNVANMPIEETNINEQNNIQVNTITDFNNINSNNTNDINANNINNVNSTDNLNNINNIDNIDVVNNSSETVGNEVDTTNDNKATQEELENPVVEMINNKKTMKLILTLLIVLFVAVLVMPKVFELLNRL